MSPLRVAIAWLALTAGIAPHAARASDDLVLARLGRIARGAHGARSAPGPRAVPYAAKIRAAASRHGLSPSLLAGLVRAESAFDPRAVSRVGARGLGQLMPATARSLGVSNSFDPDQNLDGSARYLSTQLDRFRSVRLALAAYHAGPERVALRPHSLPRTTRAYVERVMRFEREYRQHGLR